MINSIARSRAALIFAECLFVDSASIIRIIFGISLSMAISLLPKLSTKSSPVVTRVGGDEGITNPFE